jgi:hypothetical protein
MNAKILSADDIQTAKPNNVKHWCLILATFLSDLLLLKETIGSAGCAESTTTPFQK